MVRWISRLAFGPLKSDLRWLLPILVAGSFALAALVPVQALNDASQAGFNRYSARVLGADLRVDVQAAPTGAVRRAEPLLTSIAGEGGEIGRIQEMGAAASSSSANAPVLAVVVEEGRYPFFGRELWSTSPEEALVLGVAVSANAAKSLAVGEGDELRLFGTQLEVVAIFPETLLTLTSSGDAGTIIVSRDLLETSGAVVPEGREYITVRLPADPGVSEATAGRLKEVFGEAAIVSSEGIVPVIDVGLARLEQAFLWCALLIIFICSFGLSFGVEDYVSGKADEIATLKILGFSAPTVGLVFILRLALLGILGGLLAAGLGTVMTSAMVWLAGAKAADVADLVRLSSFPWDFFVISILLVVAFGAFPLLQRLREKPQAVLWSKVRGFPLERASASGYGSLLNALLMAIPVMLGLAYWYSGPQQVATAGPVLVLGIATSVLLLVGLQIWALGKARESLPVSLRWPLTYLRIGAGRLVASTTAVALALAVGAGTVYLDRAIDWELQAAIREQVPFSVVALMPYGSLTPEEEQHVAAEVSELDGVEKLAYCDTGYAYWLMDEEVVSSAQLIKAVAPQDFAAFGSTLAEDLPPLAPGVVPCSLWEESVGRSSVGPGTELTLALGPSRASGPEGEPFKVLVMGLDPQPGLRVGLNAPITVPAGTLDLPVYRFLGVRVDPAYTSLVATALEDLIAQGEVHDFGAIETMLTSAAEELSFLWWTTALFALLVSIIIFLTTSSMARAFRSFTLALLRTLGISGWRLRVGPYAEAVTQGVVSGVSAGLVSAILVRQGLAFFFAVDLTQDWVAPALALVTSLVVSLLLQSWSLRRDLQRSALEVLRSE